MCTVSHILHKKLTHFEDSSSSSSSSSAVSAATLKKHLRNVGTLARQQTEPPRAYNYTYKNQTSTPNDNSNNNNNIKRSTYDGTVMLFSHHGARHSGSLSRTKMFQTSANSSLLI